MSAMVFQLRNIRKDIGGKRILDIPFLEIANGELLILIGPNGAGKSTLLRILHLIEAQTSGDLIFKGEDINYPASVLARRKISMVFQRPELLSGNVFENILFPLKLRGVPPDSQVEEIMEKLDLMHLVDLARNDLSGGELQRVAIARAVILRPHVLLLDEPTANLDPYNVELIERIIQDLHKSGTTIVMVTHNIFQAQRLATRVGLMLNGEMVELAVVEKFFNEPKDERVKEFVQGRMIY